VTPPTADFPSEPAAAAPDDPLDRPQVPRRLWRATGLQVVGRLYGSATTFLVLALLARTLSPDAFGRYTFYLALFALLDALTDFGTGSVAVRRSSENAWSVIPVLRAARRIRLRLGFASLAAVSLAVVAFDEPGGAWVVLAALYPLTHALELSATVLKTRLAWEKPVLVRAFAATLRLGAVVALVQMGVREPGPLLFATAAGSAVANVALHFVAAPSLPKPTIAVQPERNLLREAWPLGVALLAQQTYFYLDNVFLRALRDEVELGHYNAAVRWMSLVLLVAQYAALSGLPWLAKRHAQGELSLAAARLSRPLVLASAVVLGLLSTRSAWILEWTFGAEYRAAAPSLEWLFAAAVAVHAGAVALTALVASGSQRAVLVITVVGVLGNAAGNAWAVPRFGAEGAAWTTFGTEVWIALASGAVLFGRHPKGRGALLAWLFAVPLFLGARALAAVLA
jgi:O-antigen/teichoic acid export membrane protein